MPNLSNYPFRTAKVIDGKTYVAVEELNEILDNLQELGPVFKQIADATKIVKAAFTSADKTTNLLVEEMKGLEGNS